jgi:hypothetical protein
MNMNQQKAVELNLDIVDVTLIDWFTHFINSGRMEFKVINGEVYWWVSYKKIAEDLPILGFKDRQVAKRFKALCEREIFDVETVLSSKGKKAFLRLKSAAFSALYEDEKAMYPTSDMAQNSEIAMYPAGDMAMYPTGDMDGSTKVEPDKLLGIKYAPSNENPSLDAKHGSEKEAQISTEKEAEEEAVINIPLNAGEYGVKQSQIDSWQELYPNVDVMQQLRSMKGWAQVNPRKRKTRNGVERFINSWLSAEQNKGSRPSASVIPWNQQGKTGNAGFVGRESGEIDL